MLSAVTVVSPGSLHRGCCVRCLGLGFALHQDVAASQCVCSCDADNKSYISLALKGSLEMQARRTSQRFRVRVPARGRKTDKHGASQDVSNTLGVFPVVS